MPKQVDMFFREVIDEKTKEQYKSVCQIRGKTMTEDFCDHMKSVAKDYDRLNKLIARK